MSGWDAWAQHVKSFPDVEYEHSGVFTKDGTLCFSGNGIKNMPKSELEALREAIANGKSGEGKNILGQKHINVGGINQGAATYKSSTSAYTVVVGKKYIAVLASKKGVQNQGNLANQGVKMVEALDQ